MGEPEHLKSLLKEAELYLRQGLLRDAGAKYAEALKFVQRVGRFKNQEQIEGLIKDKMREVDQEQDAFDHATAAPKLSKKIQELIKRSFAFAKTGEAAALEGALALAKFGQYEAAVTELQKLLDNETLTMQAAKNIIQCHFSFSGADAAIGQLREWMSGQGLIGQEKLIHLRDFLADILKKNGIEAELPEPAGVSAGGEEEEESEAEDIDISAVSFEVQKGPLEGKTLEFNTAFQMGNVVSIIVSAKQKGILDFLRSGTSLPDVQCYSPITVFRSEGKVTGRSKIQDGPREGDYMVDIAIEEV